jgi:hypothetical protein
MEDRHIPYVGDVALIPVSDEYCSLACDVV